MKVAMILFLLAGILCARHKDTWVLIYVCSSVDPKCEGTVSEVSLREQWPGLSPQIQRYGRMEFGSVREALAYIRTRDHRWFWPTLLLRQEANKELYWIDGRPHYGNPCPHGCYVWE